MSGYTDHMGLVISTRSAEAARRYVEGVRLFTDGSADAVPTFAAAVAADRSLGVALAALCLARAHNGGIECGDIDDLASLLATSNRATRRERQHIEIIVVAGRGDVDRARALGKAHLTEFPGDAMIAHVVAGRALSISGEDRGSCETT
jgi:hypothetical protein